MKSVQALRAFWFALVAPWRVRESTTGTAAASFALAVLLGSLATSGVQMLKNADVGLEQDAKRYAMVTGTADSAQATQPGSTPDVVALDTPSRQFTALLGNNLLMFVLSIVVSAGLYMLIARFLTNENYTFSMALVSVSAANSIAILGIAVSAAVSLATHSMRFGPHAGSFVDPFSSPFLFLWLQRIDLFGMWQALATGVALTTWVGLDRRYGYIVGAAAWILVLLVFFGLSSLIAWILAQSPGH